MDHKFIQFLLVLTTFLCDEHNFKGFIQSHFNKYSFQTIQNDQYNL